MYLFLVFEHAMNELMHNKTFVHMFVLCGRHSRSSVRLRVVNWSLTLLKQYKSYCALSSFCSRGPVLIGVLNSDFQCILAVMFISHVMQITARACLGYVCGGVAFVDTENRFASDLWCTCVLFIEYYSYIVDNLLLSLIRFVGIQLNLNANHALS